VSAETREYEARQPVEVLERGNWVPARVKERAGRGLFVRLDKGGDRFCHFNQVRPVQAAKPLAKIGDVVRPPLAVVAAPEPTRAPPPASAPPASAPPASAPPPPELAKPPPITTNRGGTYAPTRIGDTFRTTRILMRFTQAKLGAALGLDDHVVSRFELGVLLPSDEVLLRFHALGVGVALEDLEAQRDADAREPDAPKLYEPPPPAAKRAAGLTRSKLYDALEKLVPSPEDGEALQQWLGAAETLLKLARGGS
jgi:transcriptional regulator with XRE-family HTH domain